MARRTQTYAVRLAVEGGGQVKAELVSVGQSGEQSLKRIEAGGERASGGLKGRGRQAELLRTGIRTLGGRADRHCDGRWSRRTDRSLDLGGGCDRQDRGQDRRRRRGAAGAAVRCQSVRRRAADARYGTAAVHPPRVRGGAGHRRGQGCAREHGQTRRRPTTSQNKVSMIPGATVLTVIPCNASSFASPLVSVISAALAAW